MVAKVFELKNLEYLYLQNNQLKQLPPEIAKVRKSGDGKTEVNFSKQLERLRVLDVSNNPLEMPLEPSLKRKLKQNLKDNV